MESIRQKQIGELIKRNFSLILQQEGAYIYGKEPLVTIMNVKMTPDLAEAKIYLSVYNTENKQAIPLLLEAENSRLRHSLAARIKKHVRIIPNIIIFLDDTIDEMYKVEQLFKKIEEQKFS